jgi:hypothetical protein
MLQKCATNVDATSISKQLVAALGEAEVLRIARECRWLRRLRDITPLALVVACLSTLGTSKAMWIADILRTFNAFTGLSIRYKPFHNQLRKASFPEFMRRLLERTLDTMTRPVLSAGLGSKLLKFRDILLHDGSSFALKDGLKKQWPGRFTKISPAAVELHVTMSAFDDNPIHITLAPDKEAERALGPMAEDLRDCLLLEDRGYEHRRFFLEMQNAGGFFIVRGNKAIRPIVRRAYDLHGRRLRHLEGRSLSWEALPSRSVDIEIEWAAGAETYHGRLVALYKRGRRNQKTFVYLHTNLQRREFSAPEIAGCTACAGRSSSSSRSASRTRICTGSTRRSRRSPKGSSGRACSPSFSSAPSRTPPSSRSVSSCPRREPLRAPSTFLTTSCAAC